MREKPWKEKKPWERNQANSKKRKEKIKGKGRYCVEKDQKLFEKAIRIYFKQEKKDRNQS
jgi:hypothetical protein